MAEKNYLDKTGLALVWEKIKNLAGTKVDKVDGKGLSTNDYTSDEKTKLANIASGAQVNVLEGIQKNGTAVTITNKIANISVPTKTSDITNDSGFITTADIPEGAAGSTTTPLMDGTAAVGTELAFARGDHRHPTDTSRASASDLTALTTRVGTLEGYDADNRLDALEEAVGTGGSVDSKISTAIQGLDSSITAETNKAIASVTVTDGKITASTKVTIPTNNNQLTNGAGYQTASQVTTAIEGYGYQTASDVSSAISSAITTVMDYKGTKATVAQLPSTGNKQGDVWHVTEDDGEYAWNGTEWEALGSAIDLSGYVEDSELVAITSSEINTICV